jgi:endoglucanase
MTYEEIMADLAANPNQRYRIRSDESGDDLVVSGLVITEIAGAVTTPPPVTETPPSATTTSSATTSSGGLTTTAPPPTSPPPNPGFRNISATQLVSEIGVGWNLGNSLDAHRRDNPVGYAATADINTLFTWRPTPTRELIRGVKAAGFDSIRIPVTWYKVAQNNSSYTINPAWMARVKQVVDWAVAEDMYIILNTHHEYPIYDGLVNRNGMDMAQSTAMVRELWRQIATEFRDYNEKLIFAGLNEPRDRNDSTWYGNATLHGHINTLNQTFVTAVRNTGGNNANRILMVPAYAASGQRWNNQSPFDGFRVPNDTVSGKLVLAVHRYEPNSFTLSGPGGNWTEQQVRSALNMISTEGGQRHNLPIILSEWGATNNNNEAARAAYSEFYVRTAHGLGMKTFLWDNGSTGSNGAEHHGYFDRGTGAVRPGHQSIIDGIMRGAGRNSASR